MPSKNVKAKVLVRFTDGDEAKARSFAARLLGQRMRRNDENGNAVSELRVTSEKR